jgi:diguanylate cyclase (GGDEF)-like protein
MNSWRSLQFRNWCSKRAVRRLVVVPAVLSVAGVHLLLVGNYLWSSGAVLRSPIRHLVDVMLKLTVAAGTAGALAVVWRLAPADRGSVRVLDWFGGGLLALTATLVFSTPDEFFKVDSAGPWAAFLLSRMWAVWGAAGGILLVVATGKTARELNSERKERERLEALMEFTSLITSLDYQTILDQTVNQLHKLLRADACVLYLWNDAHQVLVPVAGFHQPDVYQEGYASRMMTFRFPVGFGLTGWVMQTGDPYITADLASDPRSQGVPGYKIVEHSCLLAPIQMEGHRLGVVRLTRRGINQFTHDDLDLTLSFTRQAALVIEHGRTVKDLSDLSITDGLTGLYNSRHFYHVLNVEVNRANRHGRPLSLVMVDSDSLRRLNDRFGHQRGDDYLQVIGNVIRENIRQTDYAFRYAGDEFLLLLPETGTEDAAAVAERIRWVMQGYELEPGLTGTVSVGVAVHPLNARDSEGLLAAADQAVSDSKQAGKNRVTVAGAPQHH